MNSYNNGIDQLAALALDFSDKALGGRNVKPKDLEKLIDTIREVPWTIEIIRKIGSERFNKIRQKLRGGGPEISITAYTALEQIPPGPIGADTLEIVLWGIWGDLALKYHIQNALSAITIREAVISITQGAIKSPHWPL